MIFIEDVAWRQESRAFSLDGDINIKLSHSMVNVIKLVQYEEVARLLWNHQKIKEEVAKIFEGLLMQEQTVRLIDLIDQMGSGSTLSTALSREKT